MTRAGAEHKCNAGYADVPDISIGGLFTGWVVAVAKVRSLISMIIINVLRAADLLFVEMKRNYVLIFKMKPMK